ncbi:hypothetical protein ACOSQ2_028871 [Xanthoceras sorbifolium]
MRRDYKQLVLSKTIIKVLGEGILITDQGKITEDDLSHTLNKGAETTNSSAMRVARKENAKKRISEQTEKEDMGRGLNPLRVLEYVNGSLIGGPPKAFHSRLDKRGFHFENIHFERPVMVGVKESDLSLGRGIGITLKDSFNQLPGKIDMHTGGERQGAEEGSEPKNDLKRFKLLRYES